MDDIFYINKFNRNSIEWRRDVFIKLNYKKMIRK